MTKTQDEAPQYIKPNWPERQFNLRALDGGWEIGPFTKDSWEDGPDRMIIAYERGPGAKPTGLRARGQQGDLIQANDGDNGPMDYLIVRLDTSDQNAG